MSKDTSIIGSTLIPDNIAIPCGLYASYYPEGKFQILDVDLNKTLNISTEDLASDQGH